MGVFRRFPKVISCVLVFGFFVFTCAGCQDSKKEPSQSESSALTSKASSKGDSGLKRDVVLKYKNYEVGLDEYMCVLTDFLVTICSSSVEINSEERAMAVHKDSLRMAKQNLIIREKLKGLGKDISEEQKKTIQDSLDESFSNGSFDKGRAESLKITKEGLKGSKEDAKRLTVMVNEGLVTVDKINLDFEFFDDETTVNFDALDSIDVFAQAKVVSDLIKQKSNSGQKCHNTEDLLVP